MSISNTKSNKSEMFESMAVPKALATMAIPTFHPDQQKTASQDAEEKCLSSIDY